MRLKHRPLEAAELEAIETFAADFGRTWKEKLNFVYWYNARVYRSRAGKEYPILHRMRNELGPSWLVDFKLPKKETVS
jgi:hypothetical protein